MNQHSYQSADMQLNNLIEFRQATHGCLQGGCKVRRQCEVIEVRSQERQKAKLDQASSTNAIVSELPQAAVIATSCLTLHPPCGCLTRVPDALFELAYAVH